MENGSGGVMSDLVFNGVSFRHLSIEMKPDLPRFIRANSVSGLATSSSPFATSPSTMRKPECEINPSSSSSFCSQRTYSYALWNWGWTFQGVNLNSKSHVAASRRVGSLTRLR